MMHALGTKQDYKDPLKMIACDTQKENCMCGSCTLRPGASKLYEYFEANVDWDEDFIGDIMFK